MKNVLKRNQIMITALAIMIAVAGYLNFAGTKAANEELTTANASNSEDMTALLDLSDEDIASDIGSLDSDQDSAAAENYLDNGMAIDGAQSADAAQTANAGQQADAAQVNADAQVAIQADGMDEASAEGVNENLTADGSAASSDVQNGEIPGEAVFTSSSGVTSLAGAKLQKEQTRAKNKETLLQIINNGNISDDQKQDAINGMIALTDTAEKETAAEILLEAKGFSDVVVSITGDAVDVVVNAASLTDAQCAQIEDIVTRKTGINPENIIISPVTGN